MRLPTYLRAWRWLKPGLGKPEYALATSERVSEYTKLPYLPFNPQLFKTTYPHRRSEHVTGTGSAARPTNQPPEGHTLGMRRRRKPRGRALMAVQRAFNVGAPCRFFAFQAYFSLSALQ